MKRFVLSFFIFLIALEVLSQSVITGNVCQETGESLPGANVYLLGTYDGTTSRDNGEFRFKTTKTGLFVLQAGYLGYEPFSRQVELKGDTIYINIRLKQAFNELTAVTIIAGTFEAGDKKQAVTITPLDMLTTAGAAGDVYGALQSLPGTITNGESGRLFVKGGDSEESLTFIDGSLVAVPYTSTAPNHATRGRFNPFMFKGTVFSTGGYSAEYGQALSSVLLLHTNDMPAEDQLDLSLLMIGVEMAGTKKWNKGAITGTLTYNNMAPYMTITPQNYDWKHYPESASGALSIRQKTSDTGLLKIYASFDRGGFTLNQNNLDSGGIPVDYNLNNDHHFMNVSWNTKLRGKWALHAAGSFTNNQDDIRFSPITISKKLQGLFLKEVFTCTFTDKLTMKLGGEFFRKSYSQYIQMEEGEYDHDFTNHTYSGFAEAQLYASSKLVTRLGGRAEYSGYLKRFTLVPRLSAAYKVTPNSQFSLAYGWFYQYPVDDYLLYTNQLKPERADHYILSFQSSANSRTFRVEWYYKDYKELVKQHGSEFYRPSGYSNQGYGYATGIDMFWRDKKTIKNGDYWISYSCLDTKRDYRNFPETAIPTFASKHNWSVVYKHWLGGLRSLAGINLKYSSPRVYNDPNSPVFNGEKMLPYRSLDLSWSFLYRQHVIFYGAVTNVAGFKNEFGRTYATTPDISGKFPGTAIQPSSERFFVLGCFITLTRSGIQNQLEKIE